MREKKGLSLVELLLTIALISIIVGQVVAMRGTFAQRQRLDYSCLRLIGDLRQTQQFARVRRTRPAETYGYGYYGIRFFDNLGENSDRMGWKILRFCTDVGNDGDCDQDPSLPIDGSTFFEVVKSPVGADSPEFVENTFFAQNITLDATSEFQIGDTIVFTPEGSATLDGDILLTGTIDDIVLSGYTGNKTIQITPLTGYVRIQ